ncbi:MAG: arabinan endo-1,5-alpha-L-arabinosidase [Akkermansiaceae bacterium]|nr:arabinan endo-1,5-alpha-L-arabinosidase [Akkermansiaceae bacterium]
MIENFHPFPWIFNRVLFVTCATLTALLYSPPVHAQSVLGGAADPTVVAGHNGDSGTFAVATGRGIQILHSEDLISWKLEGRVFKEDVPPWAKEAVPKSKEIWAPDISFHDGLYHLYYSVSSFGSQRSVIGLAVNRRLEPGHPENRWIDRGLVVESHPGKSDFNTIDPALFVDDGGRWTLFFGSFWSGIKAISLDPKTGKPGGKSPEIIPIAKRAADVPEWPIEAPYVIKHAGWYYLFVSWDHCCRGAESDYKVVVGRSKSALGPYLDKSGAPMLAGGGTLVLESDERWAGPGHNGVLQTERGDFMVHHAFLRSRPHIGRLFLIRPLIWAEDGWPTCGEPINRR